MFRFLLHMWENSDLSVGHAVRHISLGAVTVSCAAI